MSGAPTAMFWRSWWHSSQGGDAQGLYNNGGVLTQFRVVTATQVMGGVGGGRHGGNAIGAASGVSLTQALGASAAMAAAAPAAFGLHTDGITPTVRLLIAQGIAAVQAARRRGGNAQDELNIQVPGPLGPAAWVAQVAGAAMLTAEQRENRQWRAHGAKRDLRGDGGQGGAGGRAAWQPDHRPPPIAFFGGSGGPAALAATPGPAQPGYL